MADDPETVLNIVFPNRDLNCQELQLGDILDSPFYLLYCDQIKEKCGHSPCEDTIVRHLVENVLTQGQLRKLVRVFLDQICFDRFLEKLENEVRHLGDKSKIYINRGKTLDKRKTYTGLNKEEDYHLKFTSDFKGEIPISMDEVQMKELENNPEVFRHFGPINQGQNKTTFMFLECDWFKGQCEICWSPIRDFKKSLSVPLQCGNWAGTYCSWDCLLLNKKKNVNWDLFKSLPLLFKLNGLYVS